MELKQAMKNILNTEHKITHNGIMPEINSPDELSFSTQKLRKTLNKAIFVKPKFTLIKENIQNVDNGKIKSILTRKVKKEIDRHKAEFNYKLLTDTIANAKILSKWKPNVNKNCTVCNIEDTTMHMIFECEENQNVWRTCQTEIGKALTIENILTSNYAHAENELISEICYILYKFWIEVINDKLQRTSQNASMFVKKHLLYHGKLLELRERITESNLFRQIGNAM